MQEQPTCKRCGATFDPTIDLYGNPKPRRTGRPAAFCSKRCQTAHNNANRGDGGDRSWPQSETIEQQVCDRYTAGESTIVLSNAYGVSAETIIRLLKRNDVVRRGRNTRRKGPRGGRIIDKRFGYAAVLIYPEDPLYSSLTARATGTTNSTGAKYVAEHRLVMARAIGRALHDNETVHHKNGIKDDNRIENLELWASIHHKGQRVQDLIAFVVENYPVATRAALDGKQLSLDLF